MTTDINFRVRSISSVIPVGSVELGEPPTDLAGDDYWALLGERPLRLAADFVFLDRVSVMDENARLPVPTAGWWVFGRSGSGDLWLLKARAQDQQSEVAFLDHDKESRARVRPLKISLSEWFQLADLIRQVEDAIDRDPSIEGRDHRLKPPLRRQVQSEMERISPGLSKRFPYTL